jgi:hypothetical protein
LTPNGVKVTKDGDRESQGGPQVSETLTVHREAALFVEIAARPMNLLGPDLVRDLVPLSQRATARNPETQRRTQAAMKHGFQTHDGELSLARLLGDLAERG